MRVFASCRTRHQELSNPWYLLFSMVLGKYETVELIAEGGMAAVYRGRDIVLGRPVAIKLLKATPGASNLELSNRFLNEAKILGRLQHPTIVTLFDFGTTAENQTYIVMELVEGVSLSNRRGKLTVEVLGQFLRAVALGLDYAHSAGVIHRDVKPSNLLIAHGGNVKILDFGIAILDGSRESRITDTGIVVGTPSYMSPEQISGGAITSAVDQFSLAVVSFELLTGQRPFSGETVFEEMAAIVMRSPIDLISLNPTLGTDCTAVMLRALSKNPKERFSTCFEFVTSLLRTLDNRAQPNPPSDEPSFSVGEPREKLRQSGATRYPTEPILPRMETRINLPVTVGLSVMSTEAAPTSYAYTVPMAETGPFFGSDEAHFGEIKRKLNFYQDELQREYEGLTAQVRATYLLWLVSVSMAFVVLLAGVVLFLLHQTTSGAVTTASSAMLYFLQRVFQQREDAYRKAADEKRSTVEYGNQWGLVLQTIQGMEDPHERRLREVRLVEVMTDRLVGKRA